MNVSPARRLWDLILLLLAMFMDGMVREFLP